MTLDSKVAMVSGSGRGIGRAVAEKLASEGARVVVNDLDEGPAKETVAAIEAAGRQALAVLERCAAAAPLGRAGTAEEAAGAVWMLCAPEPDHVTGQVLACAGGLTSVG